jgi:hypothetical protein
VLAARLRSGGVDAPPRSFAWGQAIRTVALVSLLVSAATVLAGLVNLVWSAAAPPEDFAGPGALRVVWALLGLLWVAAYLALVGGRWRVAQRLAVVALVPSLVWAVSRSVTAVTQGSPFALPAIWIDLLVTVALTAALVAFHRDAPPVRRTPWLVALPVGAALAYVPFLLWLAIGDVLVLDWAGITCVAVAVAAAVHLAGLAAGRVRPDSPWTLALAVLAAAAVVLRVTSLADIARLGGLEQSGGLLLAGTVELAAVLVLGIPLAVLARRRLPAA